MRINKVLNNTVFKGVYYVAPETELKKSENGLQYINGIDKLGFSNANTEKLFKYINPDFTKLNPYLNKDFLLIQRGQLTDLVTVNSPALILANDEHGQEAADFLKLANDHDDALTKLYGKSARDLEKELSETEIEIAKNPTTWEIRNRPTQSYKDRLIETIEAKLKVKLQKDEGNLYDSFLKKAKVWTVDDLRTFESEIINSVFKRFIKYF